MFMSRALRSVREAQFMPWLFVTCSIRAIELICIVKQLWGGGR